MSFDSLLHRPPSRNHDTKSKISWPFNLSSSSLPPPASDDPRVDPLAKADPEDDSTKELNEYLDILVERFPDVEPEVFREMLAHFDGDSRLQLVIDTMLNHGEQWIKGRRRSKQDREKQAQQPKTPHKARFRSEAYKEAVQNALYAEFKGLSRSQIRAVLAECNYSYTDARPVLIEVVSRSWRFTFVSFFKGRKAPSEGKHPLVIWPDGPQERPSPRLRYSASAELNRELHSTLIVPLLEKHQLDQELKDRQFADQLNEEEATKADAMYDCECCYTSETFEHVSTCDTGGHFICYRCIRHTINEAIYGQGWTSSIDSARGTLRCIASSSVDCDGAVPFALVQQALKEGDEGEKLWNQLQDRLCSESLQLLTKQTPLVRCPFCPYAEIDELYVPPAKIQWSLQFPSNLPPILTVLVLFFFSPYLNLLLITTLVCLALQTLLFLPHLPLSPRTILLQSRTRILRTQRTQKFTCLAPTCHTVSCLRCQKPWIDPHTCFETEAQALRAAVEKAMSEAVKRTCPACNLSFVKATGCNKLTCVCGYIMCYVCREQIAKQGYDHFCTHFRLVPGRPCAECRRCDLYHTESDDVAVKRAEKRAKEEWLTGDGKEVKEMNGMRVWEDAGLWTGKGSGKERVEAVVDAVVGAFVKWKIS